ncbi:unnamed protein product [Urochloa humidicola]
MKGVIDDMNEAAVRALDPKMVHDNAIFSGGGIEQTFTSAAVTMHGSGRAGVREKGRNQGQGRAGR